MVESRIGLGLGLFVLSLESFVMLKTPIKSENNSLNLYLDNSV